MRNPRKFERCVSAVKRSLKKYGRSGNAYAICKASQSNPRRWNPMLTLPTVIMTPQVLGSIEKRREQIERGLRKRKNGLFDFLKTKETVYRRKGRGRTPGGQQSSFQGVKIRKTTDGDFATSIDWDSRFDTLKDAKAFIKSWHKDRGPEFRWNKKGTRKNKGRSNPVESASKRYESFHGRPSEELVEVKTRVHEHSVLAGIGDLKKLVIISKNGNYRVTVKFLKPYPILSMNESATQLHIEGGDQSVNVRDFGIRTEHEEEVLGECRDVYYYTRKDHLGSEGGTATYHHRFGRKKPTIIYDTRNQLLRFAGGGYTIPDEGIDG